RRPLNCSRTKSSFAWTDLRRSFKYQPCANHKAIPMKITAFSTLLSNIRYSSMPNAHSRRIYVGDCFVPGFFWHKTSAGINVALAVLVKRHYIKKPDADISLTILSAKLDAKTEFVTLTSPDAEV